MATSIEKLMIRGIRSYSPVDAQVIEFFKPLTLIVGKNGCGKTTVIESLKMACTGELPPGMGKSGQAFINDPNVFNTTEIKAQIKLKYVNANGKVVVCTRSFSLTQKPGGKKDYKAFEAALRTKGDGGQEECLSYKCADLNKIVPDSMGVSKAILESVVFVHQEDSTWPLSDDASLKKRFDDIFAATDYTKALEEIKKYKNQKKADEKVLVEQLRTVEEQLETATRLRTELHTADDSRQELTEEIRKRSSEIEKREGELVTLRRTRGKRGELLNQINMLQLQRQQAVDAVSALEGRLSEHHGAELVDETAELQQLLTQQNGMATMCRSKIEQLERQIREGEGALEQAEKQRDAARSHLERLRAVEEQQLLLQGEAGELITSLSVVYPMGPAALDGAAPIRSRGNEAMDGVKRCLAERQRELAECKEKHRAELHRRNESVHKTRIEAGNCAKEAAAKEAEAAELKRKESGLVEQAADGAHDETQLSRLQSELHSIRLRMQMQEDERREGQLAERLAETRRKVSSLKSKQQDFRDELQQIDAEGDKQQSLARKMAAKEEKEAQLKQELDNPRTRKLRSALGQDADVRAMLEVGHLERELGKVRDAREALREKKEREVKDARAKLEAKRSDLVLNNSEMQKVQDESERLESDLRAQDVLMLQEGYDFEAKIAEAEAALELHHDVSQSSKAYIGLMTKAVATFEAGGTCMFCKQNCDADAGDALRGMKRKMEDHPNGAGGDAEMKRKTAELTEKVGKGQRAYDGWRKMKRLRTSELPGLQSSRSTLQAEVNRLDGEHKALESELGRLADEVNEVRDLKGVVDKLSFLQKEYEMLCNAAEQASAMQSGMFAQLRSKEAVRNELGRVEDELASVEKEKDRLEHEAQSKSQEANQMESDKKDKMLELQQLKNAIERREDMEAQLKDVRAKQKKLTVDAQRTRESEAPLNEAVVRGEAELKEKTREADAETRRREQSVEKANEDCNKLAELMRRIQRYEAEGHAQNLLDAAAQGERLDAQVAAKKAEVKSQQTAREETKSQLHSKDKITLTIAANIELRAEREKERQKRSELDALQQELQRLEGADTVESKVRECEGAIEKKKLERAQMEGSLCTVEGRVSDTKKQLNDPKYRKVDDNHRKKLIECKTVSMTVADLERYYKALDLALMKFHSTKMEDINKNITELWNKTYKGSDIDGIRIVSEHEGTTASGARKHTYRVVMRKGDTELDMRGRCSAGQKVLACLIIRLALAETFCLNCGILTLDEPTTNLDRPNIESFASALNDIIKARRQQSNFQLLVITHDEEFVQLIGRSENCSHYYRIDKVAREGGPPVSNIEKFPIARFG